MKANKWIRRDLWTGIFLTVALLVQANEGEDGLRFLKRDLAQATVAYGKAIESCPLAHEFSPELLASLRRIDLPDNVLQRALGWLSVKRRMACERDARNALADALLSLRQARIELGQDTADVDQVISTLWGTILREAVLRSEYERLPGKVRSRLESFPELAVPFDALRLYDAMLADKGQSGRKRNR